MGYRLNTPKLIDIALKEAIEDIGRDKQNPENLFLKVSETQPVYDRNNEDCNGTANVFIDVKSFQELGCSNAYEVRCSMQYLCYNDSNVFKLERNYRNNYKDRFFQKVDFTFAIDNINIQQISAECSKKSLTFIDFYAIILLNEDENIYDDEIVTRVGISFNGSEQEFVSIEEEELEKEEFVSEKEFKKAEKEFEKIKKEFKDSFSQEEFEIFIEKFKNQKEKFEKIKKSFEKVNLNTEV